MLQRVFFGLENGRAFNFPPQLVQGLEAATDEPLAQVEILGDGDGLQWEALDVDISTPGLMAAAS